MWVHICQYVSTHNFIQKTGTIFVQYYLKIHLQNVGTHDTIKTVKEEL